MKLISNEGFKSHGTKDNCINNMPFYLGYNINDEFHILIFQLLLIIF